MQARLWIRHQWTYLCSALAVLTSGGVAVAQIPGEVIAEQKISELHGGFEGTLNDFAQFGRGVASLGDLDGDGITDVAVGSPGLYAEATEAGGVWILFLYPDGCVKSSRKITSSTGGFSGVLHAFDNFGTSITCLGDVDGDGVQDIAVGTRADDGGINRGAVWILFLHADGTVKHQQKISAIEGSFHGILDDHDLFGASVGASGDVDDDGIPDLLVGSPGDDDGGTDRGAIWLLLLSEAGTVESYQKISSTAGGFTGNLDSADGFGDSVAAIGDLDQDGVGDVAVGVQHDDDGGINRGAVWILFLHADGAVKAHQKISATQGGFSGPLEENDRFGASVARIWDLSGDDVSELAVGAYLSDDGGDNRGAVWILSLDETGMVTGEQKISSSTGGFDGPLDDFDQFGVDVASLGDLNGDAIGDIIVGASLDDDGVNDAGAAWVLLLDGEPDRCWLCDLNGNGEVDQSDLGILLGWYGAGAGGDIDGDGDTDQSDLGMLLSAYGEVCQ
ncbi:MAG: FG-GAP repeat protein [Phycisphaerales bacterium]|nr:FG-GAP repeat protein [Phycisphaerales bacterium]